MHNETKCTAEFQPDSMKRINNTRQISFEMTIWLSTKEKHIGMRYFIP